MVCIYSLTLIGANLWRKTLRGRGTIITCLTNLLNLNSFDNDSGNLKIISENVRVFFGQI